MRQYLFNLAHLLLDQLPNTLLGGDPRMTLSGRMGRNIAQGRCRVCSFICRVLSLLDTDHCARAWRLEQTINAELQVAKE